MPDNVGQFSVCLPNSVYDRLLANSLIFNKVYFKFLS